MSTVTEPLAPNENPVVENATRVVWALAWPAVALNSLQVVNTMLDRAFIGRLEQAALTAHGGSINVLFMMFSLAMAIATGATALVSRGYGAGDVQMYRRAAKESVGVCISTSIVLALLTAATAHLTAQWILPKNDPRAITLMAQFVLVYSVGMPAVYVIQTLAGCLRGIGDTVSPMVISGLQILMHITLNFCLVLKDHEIFGLHIPGMGLGLVGAGIALSTSAWISAIVYLFWAGKTPLGEQIRVQIPEWSWVVRILRIAVPAAMMATLRVLSLTAFTIILSLAPGSSAAIAGMSLAFAVEQLIIMPGFGLGAAAGALVGQSLGMKRPDRAERLGWISAHHGAIVTFALSLPVFTFAPSLVGLLAPGKPEVIQHGVHLLRAIATTEVLFAYGMILIGAMQGAGDTKRPFWITVLALWGVRVPIALILVSSPHTQAVGTLTIPFAAGMGAMGAWIAMSVTQALQGFLSIFFWRAGTWKKMKV